MTLSPSAAFEQPFEMLDACHERVQRMLRLLERLRAHVAAHGADAQARQAARDVMRYFDLAAPQHHLDEERHVFPPLLAAGDPELAAVVRQLQQDHARMEADWAHAREVLAGLAGGTLATLDAAQGASLEAFAALYADHIVAEDRVAYPAARERLDAAALAAMGQDMMQRRGVR
ncbi:hemerythrin domain-containing protein [Ramlibacter sp. MAHUQ-53]|uniref:hemerythrin domain-containing protein n=1 Tax=unclassified Ramlibacter TaxID=2617605 RepID=UPI0036340F25